MFKWAIIFALISVVAGVLGFSGIAAGAATIAKVIFFLALALCVAFFIAALVVVKAAKKVLD